MQNNQNKTKIETVNMQQMKQRIRWKVKLINY